MSQKIANCLNCTNQNCLIKKHCTSANVQAYLKHKNTIRCNAGQQFILEGAPVTGLYFIYSGAVKVYRQSAAGKNQIIRFSKAGEIVGHRGFGTDYVYNISAAAIEDAYLCNFTADMLIEMLHKEPPMMFEFLLFYADQLQKSEANAKRFLQMTVRDKVMNGLSFIYRKFGQSNGYFNLTLSRSDIADFAGTSREQVTRVISTLKKEKLIVGKGKKIGIPDTETFDAALAEKAHFLEG